MHSATVDHIAATLKSHAGDVCTVAVSMGKDSSVLLDLVFRAYLQEPGLPKLNILYANTGLEAPTMARYVASQIVRIRNFIQRHNLPIQFHEVRPVPEYSMWGRVIGHGYMMPLAKVAHWCTDMLKLAPMRKKMQVLVSDCNSKNVLALVGVREQESGTRKVSIDSSLLDEANHLMASRKNKNETLYAPIRLWSDADVWAYINNGMVYTDPAEIRAVYNVTDSCGGSLRSGCSFCPVVCRDKNLEAEAARDSGLRWLLRWRNYLARLSDPKHKTKLRHFRRQRGDVAFYEKKARKKSEQDTWDFQRGYYPQRIREHFLKVVLHAQMMTQRRVPDFEWISRAELETIRQIWIERHGEVEDSLPVIYHRIYGSFWDCGTEWEIENGVHCWFSFQRKMKIPGSWKMLADVAPEIDAERILRTSHALNEALANIRFKQARGAWCDDHIERAKELAAALGKTDWRSEKAARAELDRILAGGTEPPKSLPKLGLQIVLNHLRDARQQLMSDQDREWEQLLNLYDQIPLAERTQEMKDLIVEGMQWGDPRKKGQLQLNIEGVDLPTIKPDLVVTHRQRRPIRAVWQQLDLLAAA